MPMPMLLPAPFLGTVIAMTSRHYLRKGEIMTHPGFIKPAASALALGIGLALGAPAWAATPAAAPTTTAPEKAPDKAMTRDGEAAHALAAVRLSKLDGVDIYDGANKKIGEIDDVFVDARTGQVRHLIVEIGGVAGIGGKKHVASIEQVRFFSRGADDAIPRRATLAQAADTLPAADKRDKDKESGLVSEDKLIGTDVVDATGKQIGEIEDVVIDLKSGQARFALMEFDKSWSPVDKLYAFQMSEFKPAKENGKLMLETRKEALENLPSVDKKALDNTDLSAISAGSAPVSK